MKRRRSISRTLLLPALILCLVASTGTAGGNDYVGNKKCKMCHLKEHGSWSETRMAKAFEVLKPGERAEAKKAADLSPGKDYTQDPVCLPCHTTGYGEPGGFVDLVKTPELAGVGCEMCHGPGGTYTQSRYMSLQNKEYKKGDLVTAGLVGQITEAQCIVCHNKKSPFVGKDYVFDFAKRRDQGTHTKFPLKYQH